MVHMSAHVATQRIKEKEIPCPASASPALWGQRELFCEVIYGSPNPQTPQALPATDTDPGLYSLISWERM